MKVMLLYILILFQLPIEMKFGLPYLYYFFIPIIFINHIKWNNRYRSKEFSVLLIFISYCILLFIFQVPFLKIKPALFSILGIIWPPFLFSILREKKLIESEIILKPLIVVTGIIAFAGIIEFFIDREIMGLVPRVGAEELYENTSLFYRTRSILYSTQINALFLGISSILLFEFWPKNKIYRFFKYPFFILLALAIVLTGSRSPFLIIGTYLFLRHKVYFTLSLFLFVIFGSIILFTFLEDSVLADSVYRQFDFITSPAEFLSQQIDDRVSKQTQSISNTNLVWGNGLGKTHASHPQYINTESYVAQIFSELGIIGFLLFVSYLTICFKRLKKSPRTKRVAFASLTSSLVVHGLSSPYMLIFWFILNSKDEDFS